jgi:hypothetical protein
VLRLLGLSLLALRSKSPRKKILLIILSPTWTLHTTTTVHYHVRQKFRRQSFIVVHVYKLQGLELRRSTARSELWTRATVSVLTIHDFLQENEE